MPPRWALRSLFASRAGRLALLGLMSLSIVFCLVYLGALGEFLSIPDVLFFGLVLPIYSGWKSPRHLAAWGVAGMLIAVPICAVLALDYAYQPGPAVDSPTLSGTSGPILQGALATPYTGAEGGTYHFQVTVNPQYVPANATPPVWVELWVSTCPGATGPSDPYCSSGYPLLDYNRSLAPGLNSSTVVAFDIPINSSNIWSWQMGAAYYASPGNQNLSWVFLSPYAVEGPIVGPYSSILLLAIGSFAGSILLIPLIVFLVGLLGYMWFKRREAIRKALQRPPAAPTEGGGSAAPTAAPAAGSGAPAPSENACPNCGAVVYPNEATCWKCGVSLSGPRSGDRPLPSK